jgi:hypothetical protein
MQASSYDNTGPGGGGGASRRTYNVTLRRSHGTTVVVEKQSVLHISVRACVVARALAYACVALLIQHATIRHIATCGLSGFIIFFDIIS